MIFSVKRAFASASAIAGIAALAAHPAPAQDAAIDGGSLDIPADARLFDTLDPNKRSATAKVNGQIITGTDVEQRVALIVMANEGVQIPAEEMERLRLQVLRNLIDETLQVQAAAEQDMAVTKQEVDEYYQRYAAQRFGRTAEELDRFLESAGSSGASLKRQIEGELAMNRLMQRNVQPYVNVSADEVNELYQRLEASKGMPEYRLFEIYLSSTPATHETVRQNAQRILEQLRSNGNFQAYARQFSEASTAAVGGDIGWIRLEQLQNPILETAAREMRPGQILGPIEIPGGFSILFLQDQRQVGMADPRDAILSLKQISVDFPPGISEEDARARAATFAQGVQTIKGCGDAESTGAALGFDVVTNDEIPARALPEQIQQPVLQLNIGQFFGPYGSLEEGVRVLMLCGRDDPTPDAGPDYDELMARLEEDRAGKRWQRYLRDLRRDAVVEYN